MPLDPTQTGGVDFSEFKPLDNKNYLPRLLYYADGRPTDKYFIKNVGVCDLTNDGWGLHTSGAHIVYIYNPSLVKKGDYVSTCLIKGTCFKCTNKDLAIGRIVHLLNEHEFEDTGSLVGLAYVELF